jgi:site-specific recombinase XerD
MTTTKLTAQGVRALAAGDSPQWITDPAPRGSGRLLLVVRPLREGGGKSWYFKYQRDAGTDTLPIGPYAEEGDGVNAFTVKQARDRAAEWSALYRGGQRDLRAYIERERARREQAERAEDAARRQAEAEATTSTLAQLLDAYADALDARKAKSARDTRNGFRRDVIEAFPDLAAAKARDVTSADLMPVLRRLLDAGKGRSAMKLRSHLHSAYELAARAETDASVPAALRAFRIETNPVARLAALTDQTKPRTRHLREAELRAYVAGVRALPSETTRTALLVALLAGGQRPEQLLRVTAADVDLDARTMRLRDPKGRGRWSDPREHVVPLTDATVALLAPLVEKNRDAPSIFSSDGKRAPAATTLSHAVQTIAEGMLTSKVAPEPFQLRDVRRTCETMLAGLGVSSDVRAQLLSHGITGVQAKHYDRHGYFAEKLDALTRWEAFIAKVEGGDEAAKPTPARTRAKRPAFRTRARTVEAAR